MRPFRVLSIDWDYLVKATMNERLEMFPDGGNEGLPAGVSQMIWSNRYASSPKLSDIGVDFEAMDILKEFISKNCHNIPVVVADSYVGIWNAIEKYRSSGYTFKGFKDDLVVTEFVDKSIEVINVDFHHDMYVNDLGFVDCGNWVNCLFETKVGRGHKRELKSEFNHYYWIAREDSDDSIPEECQRLDYMVKKDIHFLETLDDFKCDLLFICRSGIWSPPHLDDEFLNFYDWCIDQMDLFVPYEVDKEVRDSRYTERMQQAIANQREAYEKIRKECSING